MDSRGVALITGSSRGIGKACALELASAGYDIAVNYVRSQDAADEVVAKIKAMGRRSYPVQADIGSGDDRERMLAEIREQLGRIDLLVNNAGVAPRVRRDLLEVSEESYDSVLETNLKGAFFLAQAVALWMIQIRAEEPEQPLSIINISSVSEYAPSVARAEYCIAKAGLGMLTKLLGVRLAEHRIRVNAVRPGLIATDMTEKVKGKYDQLIAGGITPLRRWGTGEDIARAVRALAGADFDFATGASVDVDGGFHIRTL